MPMLHENSTVRQGQNCTIRRILRYKKEKLAKVISNLSNKFIGKLSEHNRFLLSFKTIQNKNMNPCIG